METKFHSFIFELPIKTTSSHNKINKLVIYPLEGLVACMTMVCKASAPRGDSNKKD
jgi:hypothetical protein